MKKHWMLFLIIMLVGISCQNDGNNGQEESIEVEVQEFLPLQKISLENMNAFRTEGTNWQIAGGVISDFQKEWDLIPSSGTGILVNQVKDERKRDTAGDGEHVFSNIEHGDLELKVKVLVARGSNSGIYFQSRYELQIRDTAGDQDVSSDDMGGIYAQWKDTENHEETIGGSAPSINAARSPGLWQEYHVLFRAPKFDDSGVKVSNAKFEYVYLNGFLVQENVEVTGPTIEAASTDEVAMGPLMIQGNHGPVAFKDFRYKIFENQKVELNNLTYKLYEGQYDYIPDFSTLEVANSGTVENFDDLTTLSGHNDGFSIVFEGDLSVPEDGAYLFETSIDDGGDLYIDDQLVVHNLGEPGGGVERGITTLTKGTHKLKQSYYQEVWGSSLVLNVEGPGIEKGEIPHRAEPKEIPAWAIYKDLNIEVREEPELIRGFAYHMGVKKTHVLSVGSPEGIHYSYDTRNSQLLNVWKGNFADVGRMWNNRGETQRLAPRNAVLDFETNDRPASCKPLGYTLNTSGFPVFSYKCSGTIISDLTQPSSENGVVRTLSVDQGSNALTVVSGESVSALSGGWYTIDNNYFIKPQGPANNWTIGKDKIIAKLKAGPELSYEIHW